MGVYDGQGQFHFVGRTGTGFSERSLKELHKRLTALEQSRPPFVNPPSGVDARGVHWVKPRLVAEVSFAEWTNEGLLRQAAFQGLRKDKPPKSVIKEGTGKSTACARRFERHLRRFPFVAVHDGTGSPV